MTYMVTVIDETQATRTFSSLTAATIYAEIWMARHYGTRITGLETGRLDAKLVGFVQVRSN